MATKLPTRRRLASHDRAGTHPTAAGAQPAHDGLDQQLHQLNCRGEDADVVVGGDGRDGSVDAHVPGMPRVSRLDRRRGLGEQPSGRLGVGHHELCVLDRHRARGHADLGDPFSDPTEVAHVGQPRGGGDDVVRGRLRGDLSGVPHRARVDGLVSRAGAERERDLAEFPQPADVGRVRGGLVFHRFRAVLVYRADPRPRDDPRPLHVEDQEMHLRGDGARLARRQPPVAALRGGLPDPRRTLDPARALGPLGRVVRLRDIGDPRLAHDDLPALFRGRRDLRGIRDGAHTHDPRLRDLQAAARSGDDRPRGQDVQDHFADRIDRRLRLRDGGFHRVV